MAVGDWTGDKINVLINQNTVLTSINELVLNSPIGIYPNPALNFINFEYAEQNEDAQVFVFDLSGSLIQQISLKPGVNRMNIEKLEAGPYIYRIISGTSEIQTGKIFVER